MHFLENSTAWSKKNFLYTYFSIRMNLLLNIILINCNLHSLKICVTYIQLKYNCVKYIHTTKCAVSLYSFLFFLWSLNKFIDLDKDDYNLGVVLHQSLS